MRKSNEELYLEPEDKEAPLWNDLLVNEKKKLLGLAFSITDTPPTISIDKRRSNLTHDPLVSYLLSMHLCIK